MTTQFQVKATRLSNSETYLIYNGAFFISKEHAECEAKDANNRWGNEIKFEVIESEVKEN
jgi:hypothetical protein